MSGIINVHKYNKIYNLHKDNKLSNVCKDNKIGMVQDDYKLGNFLNRVVTHECFRDTRSEIGWLNETHKIKRISFENYDLDNKSNNNYNLKYFKYVKKIG